MSGTVDVVVEVTTTLAARFTAGYERLVRSVLEAAPEHTGAVRFVPVVATGRSGHRRLTDSERQAITRHPAGGRNRRRADSFGPLAPAVRRVAAVPAVGRARAGIANARRRLTAPPAMRALELGMPEMGSIWLDLEPAWNDPMPRAELLTRLSAEGVHSAVLVADVMPELFPEWFDPHQRRLFGDWLRAHLDSSGLFLCISHNTEADLLRVAEAVGIEETIPTTVLPLGADLPQVTPREVELPPGVERFLLVVGTLEPRKNQRLVVDAFDRLRRRHDDLALVLVGRQGWMVDDLVERIRTHPEYGRRLLWPDAVDDGRLAWLYQHAFLTIAPSRYEGLGVPVMEALAHGCPTISSTGGALPEAGDGRVETIAPDDVDGLCVAIERHLLDPAHHEALRRRAEGYTAPRWEDTTTALVAALEELGRRPAPTAAGHRRIPGHRRTRP